MLQNTFIHIQGVGEVTERKIWASGIKTWDDCLQGVPDRYTFLSSGVLKSKERFAQSDWNYFDKALPSDQKWRAYGDFKDRALYVDIETDGTMGEDSITVIGTYNGKEFKAFVAGQNLEAAQSEIEKYPVVVTYNGSLFDMPIIRNKFTYNFFNHVHIDLRYPLRKLGYRGGLKKIEQRLGLERSEQTKGLSGWDAVRMWRAFQNGSKEALDILLAYNKEDTVNMKHLMEFVFSEMRNQIP